jgi:hypothetical protein
MRISIMLSDPWDLGEALKWQPLRGELLQMTHDEHGGKALIELDESMTYRDSVCRYVVASPRHKGSKIEELQNGTKVSCAMAGIPDEQAKSSAAMDISNWRGKVAFIGDIEPIT